MLGTSECCQQVAPGTPHKGREPEVVGLVAVAAVAVVAVAAVAAVAVAVSTKHSLALQGVRHTQEALRKALEVDRSHALGPSKSSAPTMSASGPSRSFPV
mmetsp:Transcript_42336/g.52098  ORF Transcript_42336/g.52098 Transcript_42336/m.52098 type:complete len:100 (+) Transcript_42336:849-1148(+)